MLFQVFCQAHGHGNWEALWATHHAGRSSAWTYASFLLRMENQPTNQRPASSPRELQVSESELGVQVQAWSRKSHANGPLAKGWQVYLFEHTLQGKMTSKQNGDESCHISCFFPICKAAVTSLSCSFQNLFPPQNLPTPLPSSCVAWIQIIPWNPMKRTVWSFLQPTFWVWDLSPSSTFSMCKGSWKDRFCSTGTKSHDYMQSTWLTKSTLLSKSSVWLVMFDFSQPPSPAHLLDDFFLRQENT